MKPNDHSDTDLQAHIFEGPVWDDPEDVDPEISGTAERDQDDDDVEAHASGFG